MCAWVLARRSEGASKVQNRASDPPKLELQAVVNHPPQMMGTGLGYSARAASTVNLGALSPALQLSFNIILLILVVHSILKICYEVINMNDKNLCTWKIKFKTVLKISPFKSTMQEVCASPGSPPNLCNSLPNQQYMIYFLFSKPFSFSN